MKDHFREAGDVCYADVYRDGSGVVEFTTRDDMKRAVRHLDDSKFRSHEVCKIKSRILCNQYVCLKATTSFSGTEGLGFESLAVQIKPSVAIAVASVCIVYPSC